jgi:septum site-determining protein MinD
LAKIVTVTSGKGGVGKTTSAASIAAGLAQAGKKTVVIDFDVGLRNLDLMMGCERRVVFDFVNVIQDDIRVQQALIKDKRLENLSILPASQTRDKDALDTPGVGRVLDELHEDFDYIVCDSPALYYADEAIVVANPEVSSVRDSDRIIGILNSRSKRAEENLEPVKIHLLLTRYDPDRVDQGDMLRTEDVLEILAIPLLGVIPQDRAVLAASNVGTPIVLEERSTAGQAYRDAVRRLMGEEVPMRFSERNRGGWFQRLLRRTA